MKDEDEIDYEFLAERLYEGSREESHEPFTMHDMFVALNLHLERNEILKKTTGFIRTPNGMRKADREEIYSRCESVLEEFFWDTVLNQRTGPFEDYDCQFIAGKYRVDSAFKTGGKWIAIELDGAEYHNKKRDHIRDTWILANTEITEIIRVPYAAMAYYPNATMGAISDWHREFRTDKVMAEDFTVPWRRILEDIERAQMTDEMYPFRNLDEYLDYAEATFETWKAGKNEAIAGSPKGIYLHWKIRPITRTVRT